MKPTQAQLDSMRLFVINLANAVAGGRPSPAMPASLSSDMKSGVDFSEIFAEYGFTPDGNRCLPNFDEIRRRNKSKGRP